MSILTYSGPSTPQELRKYWMRRNKDELVRLLMDSNNAVEALVEYAASVSVALEVDPGNDYGFGDLVNESWTGLPAPIKNWVNLLVQETKEKFHDDT